MKRVFLPAFLILVTGLTYLAHNVGNAITWNREISRIFYEHCVSCHHDGGTSFSLVTFPEVQPRAAAIKQAVLSRRMPPWGAVKGFGDFRNDQGLSEEELGLINDWVDSDTPRGNNANVLPKAPKFEKASKIKPLKNGITVRGDHTLLRAMTLDGILPESIPTRSSTRIFAALPNGTIEPIVWFYEYSDKFQHPFLFRKPLSLPIGTVIHGVPPNGSIILIPGSAPKGSK